MQQMQQISTKCDIFTKKNSKPLYLLKDLARPLYFLHLFYSQSDILNFCETFNLNKYQAQNKKLLSQMIIDVLNQDSQQMIALMIDQQLFLYWYVFEQRAWFSFCHVFRLSVTYKIGIKYFDFIFLLDSRKKVLCLRRKLFCNEATLLAVVLVYQSFFHQKSSALNLKRKEFHHN